MDVQPFLIASSLLAVLAQRLVRRLCPHCRQPYHPSGADLESLGLDLAGARRLMAGATKPATAPIEAHAEALELVEEPTRVQGPPPVPPDVLERLTPEQRAVIDAAQTRLRGVDKNVRTQMGLGPAQERPVFYRAVGCSECAGTGYRGRLGIYELLQVDEPIRRAILDNADSNTISRIASQRGMRSLREDGARQVLAGRTSLEDVLAATQAGEMEA
jgi:general secretion pathway protein E